jgi:uncharacterized membrane protein
LEAFSDGVFAVAITLLALNLTVPPLRETQQGHRLATALLDQWPVYLAYGLSFITILIMWLNHHRLFHLIKHSNHLFLLLNGFLLMVITTIPFATSLLATYLAHSGSSVAQIIYSGVSLLMAITYNFMWAYASRDWRLLDREADPRIVESVTKQYRFGPALYVAAFVAAFFSTSASLVMCILLAIFFALPSTVTRALGS